MNPLARLGLAARNGFGRVTPDPFVLAVGLTAVVMVTAVVVGDAPAGTAGGWIDRVDATLRHWVGAAGLWRLLLFGMQASLMLVLGTALAEAPIVRGFIVGAASVPRTPRGLVGMTAFVSIGLGLLNWSLSLIGGALLARAAGETVRRRGWRLHYPLLCAAAYGGLMAWHGGLSGTAPLKVTQLADLQEVLGADLAATVGVLPLQATLFGSLNLFVSGGLLVLGPLVFMAMTPPDGLDPDPRAPPEAVVAQEDPMDTAPADAVERVERSPVVTYLVALPMLAGLAIHFAEQGIGRLDLNTVNLTLWCLAMLLHGRPDRFVRACDRGIRGATGIFLQFPLYAGIMGVMAGSGLSARLTAVVTDAGAGMLAPLTFASAAVLNLFVPSGGGQWAVQGPIIMDAAVRVGVEPSTIVMAMAYGDQLTNMLQPFWALPLLAITGCKAREIVGYTAVYMAVGAVWMVAGLFLFG